MLLQIEKCACGGGAWHCFLGTGDLLLRIAMATDLRVALNSLGFCGGHY